MKDYTHLTLNDRQRLYTYLDMGLSIRLISKKLFGNPSASQIGQMFFGVLRVSCKPVSCLVFIQSSSNININDDIIMPRIFFRYVYTLYETISIEIRVLCIIKL